MIEAPPDGPLAESVVQSSNGMRGFVVSNDFSGATTAPQIDIKSAVAQDQSVGAIGQGIQNVGGALSHIFEIRNHALDQKAVLQAEAVRGDVGSQVGQALAQPGLDPTDYESTAQKIIDDNQDKLRPTSGTSPNAQDTIGGQTDVWQSQLMGAVRLHSARAAVGQAVDLATTKINGQVANGKYDDARATAGDLNARGFSSAAGHQATLQNIDTAQRTTQFKTGVTNLNTAMANGSIFDALDAATVIKANTPGDDKTKQAAFDQAMAAGIKGVQNTLETEQHKTDSNVIANAALARINGKPFTPEFIQGMMDSGHVSKQAGVSILEAAHQEYGATDDQLGPVFTQALNYNHNNDQYDNGAWKAQLDAAFYRLKPSKAQIDQYQGVIANADARNSNPGGPAASALIATGHDLIDQLVTPAQTTNDRTRQFGEFLTDPEKLRQFGFSDEQIRPLAGRTSYNEKAGPALTGPESMNAFIAAFDNRGKTVDGVQRPAIDAAEYNKLSDYTKQLAQDARDGRLVQTNLATPQAVISAGFSKAHMKAVLDARFWPLVQAGKMPLSADVESWVNDLAGKSQDAGFLQARTPVKPATAPGGDSAGQSPSSTFTGAQPVSMGPGGLASASSSSASAPNPDPVADQGVPGAAQNQPGQEPTQEQGSETRPGPPKPPPTLDHYTGNPDDYTYFGAPALSSLARAFSPTSEVDIATVKSLMGRAGFSDAVTGQYVADLIKQTNARPAPPGPTTPFVDNVTDAYKRAANMSNNRNIAAGGRSYREDASDKDVTANQLFYEWAHGIGPDTRVFDENSVMGKHMLQADYVTDGMNKVIENARKGVFDEWPIKRRLGKDTILDQAIYPGDFIWDATGANPARAFQGSIAGSVTPGKPYTTPEGTFLPMEIRMHDENSAPSGTRLAPALGGYTGGSLVPQENPYGVNGPLRTLHVDYIMKKDVPLDSKPLPHSQTFKEHLKEEFSKGFSPEGRFY